MGAWILFLLALAAAAASGGALMLALVSMATDREREDSQRYASIAVYMLAATCAAAYGAHTIARLWL